MSSWTFLTNHGRTMLFIARHPDARLRDIAASLEVTERTVSAVVKDLADAGYVLKRRQGRRNHYKIQQDVPLRDDLSRQRTIGQLLQALVEVEPSEDQTQ